MKIYLVGGAVRDQIMNREVHEKDWVVVGATPLEMESLGFRKVGKEFPVFLHPKTNEEYALARTERKVGPGYKGFTFDASEKVTLEEDLKRRDLTINAIAQDESDNIIDPYQGVLDIKKKILRHVSDSFAEDPVRILRVGRFLSRYAALGFTVHPETISLMKKMVSQGEVNALVAERVWKELDRALTERSPEKFFEVLSICGALPILFPKLSLDNEGISALKSAANLSQESSVRLATVLHDLDEDTIRKIADRYRIPILHKQIALLTARHYKTALKMQQLNADEILTLLSQMDAFRREQRFLLFLQAVKAIAISKQIAFDENWFLKLLLKIKKIDVQALIAEGYKNSQLASKIKSSRLEVIVKFLGSNDLLS